LKLNGTEHLGERIQMVERMQDKNSSYHTRDPLFKDEERHRDGGDDNDEVSEEEHEGGGAVQGDNPENVPHQP